MSSNKWPNFPDLADLVVSEALDSVVASGVWDVADDVSSLDEDFAGGDVAAEVSEVLVLSEVVDLEVVALEEEEEEEEEEESLEVAAVVVDVATEEEGVAEAVGVTNNSMLIS